MVLLEKVKDRLPVELVDHAYVVAMVKPFEHADAFHAVPVY